MKIASKLPLDREFWLVNTEYVMKKSLAQGFTLIELLIVIAVLGILAVAVLSAINPIEQINRSRDTGSRSDSEQLIGAIDRFYATKGYYPWTSGANQDDDLAWSTVGSGLWTTSSGGVLGQLSSGGTQELKSSFTDRITGPGYNNLFVYKSAGQGNSLYVCFIPRSGAFESDSTTRCSGTLPPDFPAEACGTADMSCLP
ncbi:MAG: hypothetical protein UW20_C0015G0005 [Candidatus Woesebacteria bacterium GW2011_GWB1_44_11]|uniref:Uncharacterized protein n=2 Tax=Candidatus Woeseibacteriota TaxID=1752722 RepID=A0A837IBH5_9BACT|nr:MAG: hypothetical protein UW20_C0015G0005 [Candidatus Woesebacteria bacterium GW2011_GWB1_44_11]KKT54092.1 MAG: hypothetical protein UW47_C0010G0004 [Candidatus Woesebacteria bacterium GW2011_GWA1_44_23]OGM76539.1 MAG: hypothetical protein A2208_02750 [Candidatus Woesebacteria bacterium RIFOXYA1_FULL_43_16]